MLERFEAFTFGIYEIQRCWNKIASEAMELYGLKGSYVLYLVALSRHPEGITAAQLGAFCGRDKADVSRAAAVLESKGLMKKEAGSGNLYRAKLTLTEQGVELTSGVIKRAELAEKIAGEGISDGEREVLYRVLDKIRANLKGLTETGIPAEETQSSLF